jgi:hypothetical protein
MYLKLGHDFFVHILFNHAWSHVSSSPDMSRALNVMVERLTLLLCFQEALG